MLILRAAWFCGISDFLIPDLVEWGRPRARSENISTRINKRRPGEGILNRRLWA